MLMSNGATRHNTALATFTFCAIVSTVAVVPKALADQWNKKTVVTFSDPVEVPGKVLPPGTYVFKLADSEGNRNIVQIFDKDEKHVLATVLAVPDYRMQPSDKPVLSFEERPAGSPEALRAFFYPGDNFGQMFVYPRDRATQLAKQSNRNVLAMSNDMKKNMAANSTNPHSASVQELEKTEVNGVSPSGDAVDVAIVVMAKPESH